VNVPARAAELAQLVAERVGVPPGFSRVVADKAYVNVYFDTPSYARRVVDTAINEGVGFGKGQPKSERVMVEYAQPNTHHSFHIGHARNALLGESLARLVEFAGFPTIRASYPGDIGLGVITVMWAYDKFYKGRQPQGIHERGQWLLKIYAEATAMLEKKDGETPEEAARREAYEAERREMYRKWDAGDPTVRELWRVTRQWSLDELNDILSTLGVKIEVFFFESEVDEPSKAIVQELIGRGIAIDERPIGGPVIVKIDEKLGLKKEKYRTAVILRSDGTSLYLTKDLALAKEKFEKYHVDRSVYVVDVRQSLHFQQAFKILELWGFPQAAKCRHLAYGFVTLPEGAMSSRKGTVVLFKDVADEAYRRVQAVIAE
ncbi:MAG: arginine--tRNA ligase, partial [Chloroflexota bacterium]